MLTLAAEAENALLLENDKLKQELHDMKQQFSSLKCQDFRDNNFAEVNLAEAKIEELENDKEILLSRNASLVETLNEVELQLEKERQLRIEMMRTFEEQDNEREKLLRDSANKIKQLGGMINKLKLNQDDITDLAQTPKPTSTSETQTNDSEFYVPNYCASLITELAQLKTRQDQLERSVETLQEELQKQEPANVEIGLQVDDVKQKCDADILTQETTRRDSQIPFKNITQKARLPPMTARIRGDQETLDDFFMKHIDYFKDINIQHKERLSASISHSKTPTLKSTLISPQADISNS
ncbi:hypothetical protein J6590_062210 [Homalodisca vitripennis]|nr:hypothetical protein J6590_062210 [Homalodisca vitripennis]